MRTLITPLICLSLISFKVRSQDFGEIPPVFDAYRKSNLQEKIYVHTDREFYLCGEIIWFKIYDVNGVDHKPLNLSTVAYVEVLDGNKQPVLKTKVALNDGLGSGSLFIPATIGTGKYIIRAYTRWMKNYSPEFYFQKDISIVNTLVSFSQQGSSGDVKKPDVQFFPEGGNLVHGVRSKVAFRATTPDGHGFAFKGILYNDLGDTIAAFSPMRAGIGYFYFTPGQGRNYTARITDEQDSVYRYELPHIFEDGYTLSLHDGDELRVDIRSGRQHQEKLYFFIHCRNHIVKSDIIQFTGDSARIVMDKNDLGEGINHLTLFNEDKKPLCERLYFNPPKTGLAIKADIQDHPHHNRKKVSFELTVQDNEGLPRMADLSVSVFKLDSLNEISNMAIRSYLMLASDLTGRIEDPEFYFRKDVPDINIYTDNLMLTHGWRRFKWEDIFAPEPKKPEYSPEYQGQIIQARLVYKQSGEAAKNTGACLSARGKNLNATSARSNDRGIFNFELNNYYGDGPLHFKTYVGNDSIYHVEFIDPFSIAFSNYRAGVLTLREHTKDQLLSRSIGMQTGNVYLDKELNRLHPAGDTIPIYYYPDKTYRLDEYTRFTIMEDVMREYVPEIWVREKNRHFLFRIYDESTRTILEGSPMIFYDGIIVNDVDKIMKIDPLKIYKVDIIKRRFLLGKMSISGIVSYSTYRGDLDGFEVNHDELFEYKGLQYRREFYQPKYGSANVEERLPDYRNLLYWNPEVKTGSDGNATIEFYTSDLDGKYCIDVQGITPDGVMGNRHFTLSVEKEAN